LSSQYDQAQSGPHTGPAHDAGLSLAPSLLALGLIFGLTEFVPVIGPIAGAVPVVLVAIGQSWEMALWATGLQN
jgi:predicted PurR-regulated permease PerM